MASLATLDDLEARLGRAVDNEDQAEAALADASATVRAYTGQTFTLVEDDEVRVRVTGGRVRLPQRPVVSVSAVASPVDASSVSFSWTSGDSVDIAGFGQYLYAFEVEPFRTADPYLDVTYTHGYETVPEDIVAVVCQVAGRALGRTPDATAVSQESIAGYSYSVSGAAMAGPTGLLLPERQILDRYRRPIGVIRVGT